MKYSCKGLWNGILGGWRLGGYVSTTTATIVFGITKKRGGGGGGV